MMIIWRRLSHPRRLCLLFVSALSLYLFSLYPTVSKSSKFEYEKWKNLGLSRQSANRIKPCKSFNLTSYETIDYTKNWRPQWFSWSMSSFRQYKHFLENKTIFIVDIVDGNELRPSVMCAAEAAARLNLGHRVAIITISIIAQRTAPLFLSWIPNLVVVRLENLEKYFLSSPLAPLFKDFSFNQTALLRTKKLSRINRLLGLLLLYSNGGIYIESDVIQVRSLPEQRNFAIREFPNNIRNSILGLDKGHKLLNVLFEKLKAGEEELLWQNDQFWDETLLSDAVNSHCRHNTSTLVNNTLCNDDFEIFRHLSMLPFDPARVHMLYMSSRFDWVYKRALNDVNFAFHYRACQQGFISGRAGIADQQCVSKEAPLYRLFLTFCPATTTNSINRFIGFNWSHPML